MSVCNITVNRIFDPSAATFIGHTVSSGFWGSPGVLGEHDVLENPAPADGYYNWQSSGWTSGGLQIGGYGYYTLLHEIGHGLGLAHPHDNGGGSRCS